MFRCFSQHWVQAQPVLAATGNRLEADVTGWDPQCLKRSILRPRPVATCDEPPLQILHCQILHCNSQSCLLQLAL